MKKKGSLVGNPAWGPGKLSDKHCRMRPCTCLWQKDIGKLISSDLDASWARRSNSICWGPSLHRATSTERRIRAAVGTDWQSSSVDSPTRGKRLSSAAKWNLHSPCLLSSMICNFPECPLEQRAQGVCPPLARQTLQPKPHDCVSGVSMSHGCKRVHFALCFKKKHRLHCFTAARTPPCRCWQDAACAPSAERGRSPMVFWQHKLAGEKVWALWEVRPENLWLLRNELQKWPCESGTTLLGISK